MSICTKKGSKDCRKYISNIEYSWGSVPKLIKALVLADVVGAHVAVKVIPEVIPEHGEEGVMLLNHGHAVLAAEVVRLAIGPVKPGHGLILVRPHPVTRAVLTVPLLWMKNTSLNTFTSFYDQFTSVVAPSQNCPHSPISSSFSRTDLSQ